MLYIFFSKEKYVIRIITYFMLIVTGRAKYHLWVTVDV